MFCKKRPWLADQRTLEAYPVQSAAVSWIPPISVARIARISRPPRTIRRAVLRRRRRAKYIDLQVGSRKVLRFPFAFGGVQNTKCVALADDRDTVSRIVTCREMFFHQARHHIFENDIAIQFDHESAIRLPACPGGTSRTRPAGTGSSPPESWISGKILLLRWAAPAVTSRSGKLRPSPENIRDEKHRVSRRRRDAPRPEPSPNVLQFFRQWSGFKFAGLKIDLVEFEFAVWARL